MTPAQFGDAIRRCWSVQSASTYTAANPARGQCSVTALLAQDCLGGVLARTRVGDAWHFYNMIGGERFDFTASQFAAPIGYDDSVCGRDDALADTSPTQYAALAAALRGLIGAAAAGPDQRLL